MKGTEMACPCSLMLVFVLLLVPGNAFSSSTPSYNYHGEQTTKSQDEDTNYWPATHQAVGAQHCEQHEWKDTCISPYLNKIQPLVIAPCHKRNFTDELCKDFKNILDCVTGYNISQSCIVVSLSAHFHHLGVHFGNEDFECMMSDFNNSCLNTLPAKSSTFLWRNITGDTPFRNLSSKGDTPFANTSTTVETVFGSYSTMNGNGNHENTSLPKGDTPFRNLSSKGDTPSANTSTTVETVSRSYSTMNGNGNHENTSLPKVKTVSTTASTIHVRTVSTTESTSKGKIGSTTASTINGDTPPKTTSPTEDTPPKTTSSTEDTAPKTTSSTVRTTSTTESTTKVKTVTTTASGTNGNSIFTTIPSSNGYSILTNTPSSNGNDIHTTPSSNAKVTTTTLLSNRKAIPKITPSSKGKKSVAVTRAYLALILVLTILPMFVFM